MATAAAQAVVQWSECGRYWFDEAAGDKAVRFFADHLVLTEGEFAGKPFILEGWQAEEIVRPLFGWKRRDGTRRYRRCIVWVPRKNGKTELAAGVSLLALLGDGEMSGQVYAIARDKDQAAIVFRKATAMVGWSSTLSQHLECYKTSIFCPELLGKIQPLTGNAAGKHGLSPSGIIGDEVHEWPDGDLYTFVHQGSAARRQPIEFLISTAGNRIGYGWELWDYCQKVLAGEIEDPETLIVIYAADPEDDWTDPATWAKANPNLGVSVKESYLAEECRRAKEMPRLQNDFLRYHLNIWTEQAVRWLAMDSWDACGWPDGETRENKRWADPAFEEEMVGRRCYAGMDLSTTTDLSSYTLWFEPAEPNGVWRKLTRAFVPQARIAERVRRDRAPYDQWVKSGALIATPGNVIDYEFIKAKLIEDATRFEIAGLVIDRFLSTQIAIQLNAEGLPTVLMGQGFLSMSAPSKELERLIIDRKVDHGGHPVARWCASNAAIATDPAGNIKPAKDKSTERIDVIVADVNALAGALAGQQAAPVSPWDDPNFSLMGGN